MFFYLCKVLFSGFLQFKGNYVDGQNISKYRDNLVLSTASIDKVIRPFAESGHVVRNKLCWDSSHVVGLSKQRKVGLDWYEFLCLESTTEQLPAQQNLLRTR